MRCPQRICVKRKSAGDSGHCSVAGLRANFARARLANAGSQETAVILYAYLAARKKVRDGCHHLCAATRAGTNCQDQITERKPTARSDDLAKLAIPFHNLAIFALSRSNAMSRCEYFFHRQSGVIQSLSTLELTAERHFCSILKHEQYANASISGACDRQFRVARGPGRDFLCRLPALARLQLFRFLSVRLTTSR